MELRLIAERGGQLSSFLRGELEMSSGLMNKLKWTDAIKVNGISQHTNFAVTVGDEITVKLDEPDPVYPAEDGPLTILYEDTCILAVDKPAGMLIHPSRAQNYGTLANYIAGYYRRTGQKSAFHPVTRLDRDTFGIVLLAKNAHIHAALSEQHQKGLLQKTYYALVYGCPHSTQGIIDAPIARRPFPSLLREINPEGKPSQTEYRVLEKRGSVTKLWLRPITGRTHQLRLHCADMGCPVLGDPQYCSPESRTFSDGFSLNHQILCAKSLEFLHPMTGDTMSLTSFMDAELPKR